MVSKYQFALNNLRSQIEENHLEQLELKAEARILRSRLAEVRAYMEEEKSNA